MLQEWKGKTVSHYSLASLERADEAISAYDNRVERKKHQEDQAIMDITLNSS